MATLATTHPTLADVAKRLDPNGKVDSIVEILNETNEILEDMVWMEANGTTSHTSTIRVGLPTPTWRKLYGGVQPTKSETAQVVDTTGMLEAYAEVDKKLADLNGNTGAFRLSESRAHLEGMSQEMADTLIYGNEGTEPEAFMGLAPRFNDLSAANADNIIDAGGTGSDNQSIWLVVWGPDRCHGIYPKGSMAGIQSEDLGRVTIEDVDGSGGRMEAYRSHFSWDAGIVVKDWRYVVRIANIDTSNLTSDASGSSADLVDLMTQALELPPNLNGRAVFYVSRGVRSYLRRQIRNSTNMNLTIAEVAGKHVVMFDEVPVRRVDALVATEAQVT